MRQLASRAMASRAFLLLQISLISLLSNGNDSTSLAVHLSIRSLSVMSKVLIRPFSSRDLEVTSLQLTRFAVPSPLYAGEYAECFCEFDEGHDKLKLLKWRINDTDLFHYRPSGSPRYEKLNQREEMPKVVSSNIPDFEPLDI